MKYLLLVALLLNCQVQSNPTLADEFVYGEIQSRKRVIEQAFALWQVRGQVDITDKREDNQHRIVFTDTCQESSVSGIYLPACIKMVADPQTIGSCSFLGKFSVTFIRRTYYQNTSQERRLSLITHELGHCMGMSHSDNSNDVMYYLNHPKNLEPTEAEIAKLHSMWPEGHLFKFHLAEGY